MKNFLNKARRQRTRKDPIRCSISYSKKRGNLLSIDLSASSRVAPQWHIGDHFQLELLKREDTLRFIIKPALINGYRLSAMRGRRARITLPLDKLSPKSYGAISDFKIWVFGNEIFIDVKKSALSVKEKRFPCQSLFDWASEESMA